MKLKEAKDNGNILTSTCAV